MSFHAPAIIHFELSQLLAFIFHWMYGDEERISKFPNLKSNFLENRETKDNEEKITIENLKHEFDTCDESAMI